MRVLSALLARDLGLLLGSGRGGPWLPVLFFVAVAVLFPFAVGPDAPLLARTGGGVLWIAALLAATPAQRRVGIAGEHPTGAEMAAAFGSITNSLVRGATSTSPSGPPPGVNQGIYNSREDSTGAGANSYYKALERERSRKLRCRSILDC